MEPAVYLSHPSSLAHDTGAHPERAARIIAIEQELERRGWLGLERLEAPIVQESTLAAVHPVRYIRAIDELCAAGGGAIDADTVVVEGSYEAALRAAGGAVRLVDLLLGGGARTGFSALRPPGHHAEAARAMGFCLFGNVAVAARHALDAHGAERVLVLDWDVHHGNGTNDIFHATDEVLFVSLHESPLYPGTGPVGDVGSGRGTGYTVNVPVAAGTGDATYASLLEHVVVPLARAYEPRLILLSAGFDAHRDDPLAGVRLSEGGFAAMTGTIRRLAAELEVPVGGVLEGGYDLGALAASTAATLDVLSAPEPPPAVEDVPVAPESRAALERLAARWPALTV
ncbi:histone deacetylase family protein [Conexibacter woesei]|uniref:Histone deacetylase n=1 Tax=Conexibacter woesei (strain DSM 14684 / CCUG 47730 / CIP 108061 / JCM 11494 / NBRC 100937 / ID131577) TaxID=469383 RepID=D3F2B1_CONWI|nr:histone deacetylase [Conexibacter woesei]ADB50286.1 Histone deacetylase [Conexibacter woesei DSM 14684]